MIGSSRLGTQTADSDVDLLFVGPVGFSKSQFVNALRTQLKASHEVRSFRVIGDSLVPVVHIELTSDVEVDLQLVSLPSAYIFSPSRVPLDVLESLDSASRRAVCGLLDTEKLASLVPQRHLSKFRVVLKAIRAWAKLRDISSNGFCSLGGISWSSKLFVSFG